MSISNDYEKSMISNIEVDSFFVKYHSFLFFQNACGFEYVLKMKQMCRDIETSKNILDQYYQDCKAQQFINKSLKINISRFS